MQKLLIDTDPGQDIDDLLAIWFALLRPELDIKAITTVTWPSDKRARMINRLLRYLGRSDIPVAAGMQLPLRPVGAQEWVDQQDMARSMNHYVFAQPEDPRDDPVASSVPELVAAPPPGRISGRQLGDRVAHDAIELIIRTVEQNAGEIALACIAPLTNIACALRRKPEIAPKIRYIAMMGGETALNRHEHNVAFDYVAADIVLSSGIPLFMGTWDITRRFVLGKEDCARIAAGPTELHKSIGRAIELWHPAQSWKPGPVMYDIFPMVWSFDRSFYTTKQMPVKVETAGESTRGMTTLAGESRHIEVTTDIRAAELRDLYLSTVVP